MKATSILLLILAGGLAHADPLLTSWFTANSGKYARIFTNAANETAGNSSTTWAKGAGTQNAPAYSDINEINYSANWIYIRTTGLASHLMGPWPTNFPNYPSNTASLYRIPRNPTVLVTKTRTTGGVIGRFVNGVSLFDNRDASSYVNSTGGSANPGDGIWANDALVSEGATFDAALAHQAMNNYHYHVHPIALRYQLGDHVDYNATTNRYTESTAPVTQHSPILAWASDGFPIYGPYGYSDPTNAASGVRRMVSGFTPRNGANGTTNLAVTGRTTLPAWAKSVQNLPNPLTPTQYGPTVSTFPIGRYLEDHDFLGDLGFTQTTGATVRDFDLDKFNGRICVTPEFPTPHFCYFTTIKTDGTPAFPYTMGRSFYGSNTGGATTAAVMNADTPLTQHFIGGANKPVTIDSATVNSGTVTLTWSAVEGGTYSVDASPNQSTWTSKATGLVSTGTSKSSSYAALAAYGTEYGRVNRTAIATYDAAGQTPSTVAQSTISSYSAGVQTAPTVTTPTSTSITTTAATLGGNVTAAGTDPITARGVVVSQTATNSSPQIGGPGVTVITGTGTTGVFTVNAGSLIAGTAYRFAAYATSIAGTSYSAYGSFTTISNNAGLASLVLNTADLTPSFSSSTYVYSATVSNAIGAITVTPVAAQGNATIKVNTVTVASGGTSGSINLATGANTVSTVVTAQDGVTTNTYTVTLTRQTGIESWRQSWFGTSANSGNAADNADPYKTGVQNLIIYAFFGPGQNPALASAANLPQPQFGAGTFLYDFTQPASVSGVTYGVQWTSTLQGDWLPVSDTGIGSHHVFSMPTTGQPKMFLRFKVTSP